MEMLGRRGHAERMVNLYVVWMFEQEVVSSGAAPETQSMLQRVLTMCLSEQEVEFNGAALDKQGMLERVVMMRMFEPKVEFNEAALD